MCLIFCSIFPTGERGGDSRPEDQGEFTIPHLLSHSTHLCIYTSQPASPSCLLPSQVPATPLSPHSHTELESRLHELTESLIQKQTTLEALSSDKNSLKLQLERTEVGATILSHLTGVHSLSHQCSHCCISTHFTPLPNPSVYTSISRAHYCGACLMYLH